MNLVLLLLFTVTISCTIFALVDGVSHGKSKSNHVNANVNSNNNGVAVDIGKQKNGNNSNNGSAVAMNVPKKGGGVSKASKKVKKTDVAKAAAGKSRLGKAALNGKNKNGTKKRNINNSKNNDKNREELLRCRLQCCQDRCGDRLALPWSAQNAHFVTAKKGKSSTSSNSSHLRTKRLVCPFCDEDFGYDDATKWCYDCSQDLSDPCIYATYSEEMYCENCTTKGGCDKLRSFYEAENRTDFCVWDDKCYYDDGVEEQDDPCDEDGYNFDGKDCDECKSEDGCDKIRDYRRLRGMRKCIYDARKCQDDDESPEGIEDNYEESEQSGSDYYHSDRK